MLNAEDRKAWEEIVTEIKDGGLVEAGSCDCHRDEGNAILAVAAHLAEVEGENEKLRKAFEYAEDVFMGTIPELPLWLESTVALTELRRRAAEMTPGGREGFSK